MKRRDPLAIAAVLLAVVAFAGSFTHVREVVDTHGQHGWISWAIAGMPEVSVVLAVLKVRRARRTGEATAWAWIVGTSAAGFTVSANLATAEHSPWGYVVAAWPAWASIGAAGLIEMSGEHQDADPVADQTPAPVPVAPVEVEVSVIDHGDGDGPGPEPVAPEPVQPEAAPEPVATQADPGPVPEPVAAPADPVPVRALHAVHPDPEPVPAAAGRTAQALLPQVQEAIRRRHLDPAPSAEAIRRHLQCAPRTARELRDLIRTA